MVRGSARTHRHPPVRLRTPTRRDDRERRRHGKRERDRRRGCPAARRPTPTSQSPPATIPPPTRGSPSSFSAGWSRFVKRGARVVIKPNILTAREPQFGVTTNPAAVAAVVKMCWDAGAKSVTVFDRPTAPPRQAYTVSGIQDAVRKADGDMKVLSDRDFERIAIPDGRVLSSWPLLVDIFDADVMINMPCAKTHGLAGLTLSMKNLMGVMGSQRGLIHQEFTQKIVDVNTLIKPQLIVLDAYRLLFRNGPTGGGLQDVKMGRTCVAGTNQVSVDSYGATLFGMKGDRPRLREASRPAGSGRRRLEQAHHREAEHVMATREAAPARGVHRFRRVFQFGFLALFFVLLTLTVWPLGSVALGAFSAPIRSSLSTPPSTACGCGRGGSRLRCCFCHSWPGARSAATSAPRAPSSRPPRRARVPASCRPPRADGCVRCRCSCCSARWGSCCSRVARTCSSTRSPRSRARRPSCCTRCSTGSSGCSATSATWPQPLRPGIDLATGVLTGRLVFARPLVYGFQLAVLAMFSAMLGAVVARAAHVVPQPVSARRAARVMGRLAVVSRVVDADACISCGKCARVCPMDCDLARLPRHRHQPLPGLLRLRRRLPHERDTSRPRAHRRRGSTPRPAEQPSPPAASRRSPASSPSPASVATRATPASSDPPAGGPRTSCSRCARAAGSA